jgi:hypothetical protein
MHYLFWSDFLDQLFTHAKQNQQLRFEFIGEIYGKPTVKAVCYIDIDPSLRPGLIDRKWDASTCWSSK